MTQDAPIVLDERDGILVITINRPEARNAVNMAVAQGIADALSLLDDRRDLRVGVLTGAGQTFCSGMDLKAFLAGERPVLSRKGFAGLVAQPPRKPLIAAVEGYALAGGFEIVLACDLIVAAEDARFGLPEVKRGLCASGGGLFRFPDRVPYHLAMELILTGDLFDGRRAMTLGLVNRLVAPGSALDVACELARTIAANAPLAVEASKQVVVSSSDWTTEEAFDRQEAEVGPVRTSRDAREGSAAFVEKRAPVWLGE
jgi:enoyl-CoA hydratase/carnithine racemase